MKKIIYILLALTLMLSLLVGCGKNKPASTQPNETQASLEDSEFGENNPILNTMPQETTAPQTTTPSTQPTQESTAPATQPTQGQDAPDTPPTQGQDTPATQPTQGQDTPTQPTSPAPNDPTETTAPAETEATEPASPVVDYEAFRAMSPAQQQEFQESFDSLDAFFEWYNAAYKAYQEANPPIVIGPDGKVDLG